MHINICIWISIGLGETHVNNMQFGEQEQNLSIFKMLMFKTRLQVCNKRDTFIRCVHNYNDNLSLIKPDVKHERAGRKLQEAENKHEEKDLKGHEEWTMLKMRWLNLTYTE